MDGDYAKISKLDIEQETGPDSGQKGSYYIENPLKCDEGYTYDSQLSIHKRSHTGEKLFKCNFLSKTYFVYSYKDSHWRKTIQM